jgi:hypothetical protein
MNTQNLKARYNRNNGTSKSDLSKTNILYEAENKDNSMILNNEKSKNIGIGDENFVN